MHAAKQALIRCETLDLFAGVGTVDAAPMHVEPEFDHSHGSEPGLLFRIGPDDQLDLFRHSPAEIAAAGARRALKDLAVERARQQLALLRHAHAYVQFVTDGDLCLELIERRDPRWADAALAVAWIEAELWPAAERSLQRDAMVLVRPALLALLERCEPRRFDPDSRHAHPAYLWQLLGDPAQAVAALELDAHWRDHVEALVWHAGLSEQADLAERVQADIGELCLAWPDEAESWLCASRGWASRWAAWCDLDDALPMHVFPAWCRLTRATEFPLPSASDQRPGAQLLRIADQLARNSNDLTLRKALNALSPTLLAVFLRRKPGSG